MGGERRADMGDSPEEEGTTTVATDGESTKQATDPVVVGTSLTLRRDFDALMAWLRTFPRMEGLCDEYSDMGVLREDDFAIAILHIADEICNESVAAGCSGISAEGIWRTLLHFLASKIPHLIPVILENSVPTIQAHILLLSALLCYAVSNGCRQKRLYVGRIMSLSPNDQKVLMRLIEKGDNAKLDAFPSTPLKRPKGNDTIGAPPESGKLKRPRHNQATSATADQSSEDERFASPRGELFWSPQEESNFFFPTAEEKKDLVSPAFDSYLEKMIADLREQNASLKQELDSTQQREADLGRQLERSVENFRREMIKLDSASLTNVEDIRDDYENKIARLKEEISSLRGTNEDLAKREVGSSNFEKEELERAQQRLTEMEMKLRLSNERIHELIDVRKALLQEEKAHSVSVEECYRLEKELKSVQPLKNELEKYKSRAIKAESQLSEHKEELRVLLKISQEEKQKYENLVEKVEVFKIEAEDLRQKLSEKEQCMELCSSESSDSESLAQVESRLRHENMQLRAYLAEVENQSQCELTSSQESVVMLQSEVNKMAKTIKALQAEIEERTQQLMDSQASLSHTWNKLRQAETKHESLLVDATEWKRRANDATIFTAQRQLLLKKLQNEMALAMKADKETIDSLQEQLSEWMEMANDTEEALEGCQNEHEETRNAMQECVYSLDKALMREEALQERNEELSQFIQNLEEELEKERRLKNEALETVAKALGFSCKAMDESSLEEVGELQNNSRYLMKLLENERDVFQTQFDLLKDKYQAHLSLLRQEASEDEARFEDKHSHRVAAIMTKAYEERQHLKNQLNEASQCMINMSQFNESLMETVEDMKDEQYSLQDENDRLRQQLDEKMSAIESIRQQFQTLQSEFNSLLKESRALKKDNAKISTFQNCVVYALTGSTEVLKPGMSYTNNIFVGNTRAQLRKEYELKVKSMIDEKRTLVNQSNKAIADMHKAKQQAWEADKELARLKKELRSTVMAKRTLEHALGRQGVVLDVDTMVTTCSSSGFLSLGNETKENVMRAGRVTGTDPFDVTLLINSECHDIEAIPLSSSSSSMDIPPPPPPPRPPPLTTSNESSVQQMTNNEQPTILSPSRKHLLAGPTPQLPTLLGNMILEDKRDTSMIPEGGNDSTSPPPSKPTRRVHWNEKRLWVASDGSLPPPRGVASPINDKYATIIASPRE